MIYPGFKYMNEIYQTKPNWVVFNPPTPIMKKEKVMSSVKFMGKKSVVPTLLFKDLEEMSMFRIAGCEAIYLKVGPVKGTSTCYMLEVATGKLFSPTHSRVEAVHGEVLVYDDKPSIY